MNKSKFMKIEIWQNERKSVLNGTECANDAPFPLHCHRPIKRFDSVKNSNELVIPMRTALIWWDSLNVNLYNFPIKMHILTVSAFLSICFAFWFPRV